EDDVAGREVPLDFNLRGCWGRSLLVSLKIAGKRLADGDALSGRGQNGKRIGSQRSRAAQRSPIHRVGARQSRTAGDEAVTGAPAMLQLLHLERWSGSSGARQLPSAFGRRTCG